MASQTLGGIFAASLTPLHADLSIDHGRLCGHVRWLLECGCHGAVLLGTTGEANSFSVEERIELMEGVAESGLPLNRMIVGTGCCALPDTIALTARAQSLGYRAVLLLPPFYYKNVSDDGLYDGFSQLVERVGGDELQILLYHFPRMAAVGYSLELISRLLTFYPEQVIGIKDSSGDAEHLVHLCREFPGFRIFAGTEKLLSLCLESGGSGCISASVNMTSQLCRSVFDALISEAGAEAREVARVAEELELVDSFRSAFETAPFVPGLKYIMHKHWNDPEWNTMRPPLMALGPEQASALDASLSALPELPNFVRTLE